jgi:GNAT superfamily N-acetyltransferase
VFADLELSKRLEKAEADGARAFVEARMRVAPEHGSCCTEIGGATVLFDGADSPVTQTFGLGLFEKATPIVLDEIESYFNERGAPVHHEVSPLAGVETYALLQSRGYAPSELTSVLYAPIDAVRYRTIETVAVRLVKPDEFDAWARLGAEAWSSELPELFNFLAEMGAVSARRSNGVAWFGEIDGEPVAVAALSISDKTAHMAGAATIPKARGRGAQNALLAARLAYAREFGCDIAVMGAACGSASQRNAERNGFRIAYTRTKWTGTFCGNTRLHSQ